MMRFVMMRFVEPIAAAAMFLANLPAAYSFDSLDERSMLMDRRRYAGERLVTREIALYVAEELVKNRRERLLAEPRPSAL